MKKITTLLGILFCASATIWAQKNAPEEKSIVKKEFDENGNLIQYDSTFVWQWNSDSTMNFSFDNDFTSGKEFPEMFGYFFNDSLFEQLGFLFKTDSIFNFQFGHQFPGSFDPTIIGFKELEDLQKQLQEKFNHKNLVFPEFKSPEQKEEWEELLQKQQKEKKELLKKWEDTHSKKTY
jgi:hypothetical protein